MIKKTYFFWLLTVSSLYILSGKLAAQGKVSVNGRIENNSFTSIILTDYVQGTEMAKSAISSDGTFSLSCNLQMKTICKLGFNENSFVSLILSPGEQVSIVMNLNNLNEPVINGSVDSELLYGTIEIGRASCRERV